MHCEYKTHGTCSTKITFDIDEEGLLHNVRFTAGCNGNLKAIGKLTEGMSAESVAELFAGNTCGLRRTSCTDQLSRAIREAMKEPAAEEPAGKAAGETAEEQK